jgi:micrococcal nuclease
MDGFVAPKFKLQDPRLWHYRAYVIRVIDGDTAIVFVDKGTHNYAVLKVRLAGIDAPELRPREGSSEQRSAEKVLAANATNRLKELVEGKEVIIQTQKTGKFGRWLATLEPPGYDKTANQILLEEGLAVRYGDPRPWRNE